jgi:hypothetical protein
MEKLPLKYQWCACGKFFSDYVQSSARCNAEIKKKDPLPMRKERVFVGGGQSLVYSIPHCGMLYTKKIAFPGEIKAGRVFFIIPKNKREFAIIDFTLHHAKEHPRL